MPDATHVQADREITFAQAIREALAEEMRRDSTVFILGEDVAEAGTPFKVLVWPARRIRQRASARHSDFRSRFHRACRRRRDDRNASGGRHYVWRLRHFDHGPDGQPGRESSLHVRRKVESADGDAHHHGSDAPFRRATLAISARLVLPCSRLKVVLPSTPYDAKGLLKAAIRDENPVVFFEDKMMYKLKGPVPSGADYTCRLGVADIKRVGEDITLIATSSMVQVALGAATLLEEIGISAEVVDPRTMWPLDEKTLIESAKKTSRVIILDEGYERYGVTAELASVIATGAFYDLDAPVKRMGAMHVPIPFSPPLEDATVPTEQTVFEAARNVRPKVAPAPAG
jgi:pyruvate/2-oxoglutarate/acetoin dehydrogenase E1 component